MMDFLWLYDCDTIMVATMIEDAGLCQPVGTATTYTMPLEGL